MNQRLSRCPDRPGPAVLRHDAQFSWLLDGQQKCGVRKWASPICILYIYIYMENLYGKSWKNLLLKWMILGVTPLLPFQETAHLRIYHGIASSLEWDGWILADFARAYVVPPCNNDQLMDGKSRPQIISIELTLLCQIYLHVCWSVALLNRS